MLRFVSTGSTAPGIASDADSGTVRLSNGHSVASGSGFVVKALWRVPGGVKAERIRAGVCAACGEEPATVAITRRPPTVRGRLRRKRRLALKGGLHPQLRPILCGACAAFNRAAVIMKIPPAHKLVAFLRDGGRCVYCGRALLWSEGFTRPRAPRHSWGIDHIVPRRHAVHDLENKASACVPCGSRKGDRTPDEWIAAFSRNPERLPPLLRARAARRSGVLVSGG